MKYAYREMPESMKGTFADYSQSFGFSWKEFVASVPSPMFLVTTWKSNGQPNACMQSWAAFTSANRGGGFYAVLGSVNKGGHLYRTLQEQKEAVINFMSTECYDACMATIRNNADEADEITAAGLTAEPARWVHAPMVKECFMNLECRYVWEKEIVPGDDHVLLCLEVLGIHIDEARLGETAGEQGILYNIHHPVNPESGQKTAHDYAGVLVKKIDIGEY
ncbi:MAG: flavin reductase family protein [Clostridia bacterium]|nr:flavin reductase family protein [Clostridia bacterium]